MLKQINRARTLENLPTLTMSAGLVRSAAAHNALMASDCGLLHQCAGETGLGARLSAQDVAWTSAGENIGEGGPVSSSGTADLARRLTADMLAEEPPHDGHRRNLLSPTFHSVGISVILDSSGTVWLTQDFSG